MNARTRDLREYAPFLLLAAGLVFFWLQARTPEVPTVRVEEARKLVEAGALVIDVRSAAASAQVHIPGAKLIPLEVLASSLSQLAADRARPVVVYCADGANSGPKGTAMLRDAGYTGAVNLEGGIEGWRAAGLPTRAK